MLNFCSKPGPHATPANTRFKDTNPKMSSLLVIFVWGGEAIL
jgi:hypothetical protein